MVEIVEYQRATEEENFKSLRLIHIIGMINGICISSCLYAIYYKHYLLFIILLIIVFSTLPPTKKQFELRKDYINKRL